MASTAVKIKSKGFCLVDIVNNNTKYPATRLKVFENLCSNVILGLNLHSQHQRLIFQFNKSSPDLLASRESHCTLAAAQATEVSLFSNLCSDIKPIATRCRRCGEDDRAFIDENIKKFMNEDIIRPSMSPWQAQVAIFNNQFKRHKKRICVDYSLTINVYTELDAFPLQRIDDMIIKLVACNCFSTFDLRSAYHQIQIVESERKYTAFEANGKLYEFNWIPIGVKK